MRCWCCEFFEPGPCAAAAPVPVVSVPPVPAVVSRDAVRKRVTPTFLAVSEQGLPLFSRSELDLLPTLQQLSDFRHTIKRLWYPNFLS